MMASPIVLFDIAGPDDVALRDFNSAVSGRRQAEDASTPLRQGASPGPRACEGEPGGIRRSIT
jgi:hypothetical protein